MGAAVLEAVVSPWLSWSASWWFDSWSDLVRILTVGSAGYLALVVLLRISGKRTLAKLNAFDFVVTVALGSTLATVLLSPTTSWADGAVALATLIVLQLAVAALTAVSRRARGVLTATPTCLLADGEPRLKAMLRQRVSLDEVRAAVRSSGQGDLSAVGAVILETDGSISVVPRGDLGDGSALEGVEGLPADLGAAH